MVVRLPLITTRFERHGFGLGWFSFSLQVVSEPGRLDVRAKVHAGRSSKVDSAQSSAAAVPPAVVPWTEHEEVLVVLIELFQRFISRQRAIIVFLIPPATDDQRRDGRRLQIVTGAA